MKDILPLALGLLTYALVDGGMNAWVAIAIGASLALAITALRWLAGWRRYEKANR